VRQRGPQALAFLQALPGVAHKTAACVLVFVGAATSTLPVDTHLFRVAGRIGLARHAGRHTPAVRDRLIAAMLRHGPDLAPAHFLFLLVGRSTCTAANPDCGACFLAPH
jgi:endonuclease III